MTGAGVLIVDDRPENLMALEASLEPLDVSITLAKSGTEALRWLLHYDFAVILLDVQMPELDGFETARLIKSRRRSSRIPIIFLTAISRSVDHQLQGYDAGAVDYLAKPFEPEVLRAKVAVFVELHKQARLIEEQNRLLAERLEERNRAQAAVARHAEELQRSNAELERIATVACRDLLEPLQLLGGLLELVEVRHSSDLGDEGRQLVDRARRRAVCLAGDVERLLVGARSSSEVVRRERTDLDVVLRRVRLQLAPELRALGVTVTADPLPTVLGDEWQLGVVFRRVLEKLVDQDRIGDSDRDPIVHVGLSRRRREWVMTVADDSCPLSNAMPSGPTGDDDDLGWLAVSRRIIESHGGTIWTETVVGRPPAVVFTLPVTPDDSQ